MKEDSIKKFGDAFKNFLKEENLNQTFNEKKLMSVWNDSMGKAIANRTSKLYIRDRILFVTLTSAPLKHELTMSKEKVLERLHDDFEEVVVDDIRFQ